MRPRPAISATLAVLTTSAVAVTGLALGASAASAAPAAVTLPAPTGPIESVSLELVPRNSTVLAAMATTKGGSRASRIATVEAALPGTARAAQVAKIVKTYGLTITSTDQFAVEATGHASTIAALFGTAQHLELPTAQPLPSVPAALSSLVRVAVGGDDSRPAVISHAIAPQSQKSSAAVAPTDGSLSVAQARNLHATASITQTTGPTGGTTASASGSPIVATLQFPTPAVRSASGTLLGDLDTYAHDNGLYSDGYAPHTGTSTYTVATPSGCSEATDATSNALSADEVALDQEALLTTAPQLRQRIYYAPNCGNSQDTAIAQVYTDATSGGYPIVALSTSWGQCEPQVAGFLASDKTQIQALLGVGVSMFAATGDTGAYDCVDNNGNPIASDAVDDPGSVPGVIAVGGTQGLASSTIAAWNADGYSTGGGFSCVGGSYSNTTVNGFSSTAATYQSNVTWPAYYPHNSFACAAGNRRQVPDVASDAYEGLDTIVTEPGASQATYRIYGTSLAGPLTAGAYAETLANKYGTGAAATSAVSNYGGLAKAVYADTSSTTFYGSSSPSYVDVTRGSNGDYSAASGWDPVTGLGLPHWPALLADTVFGGATPTTTSTLAQGATLSSGSSLIAPNGTSRITMNTNGDLAAYDNILGTNTLVWHTNTSSSGAYAVLQAGNLVVRSSAGAALWQSATGNLGVTALTARNNGTVALTSAGGIAIFQNGVRTGATGGSLPTSGRLDPGQYMLSPSGTFKATMQLNGDYVVTQVSSGNTSDDTKTSGYPGTSQFVGTDGNFVMLEGSRTIANGGATGNPYASLSITDQSHLTVTAPSGVAVWYDFHRAVAGASGAQYALNGSLLPLGFTLGSGKVVWSIEASHDLTMTASGDIQIRDHSNNLIWHNNISSPGATVTFQSDGNLVERSTSGAAVWSTGSQGKSANSLALANNGVWQMRNTRNAVIWQS